VAQGGGLSYTRPKVAAGRIREPLAGGNRGPIVEPMADVPPPPRTLGELAAISDPGERAKAVSAAITDLRALISDLAGLRREAIVELRRGGMLQADVAKLLGVTYGRVSQLEAGTAAPRGVLVERSVPTPPATRAAPSLFLAEGEAQSVQASRVMLHVGPVPAPPHVAELLRVEPGAPAIRRRKLQRVGGIPVRLPDSWHTLDMAERVPALTSEEFVEGGMERAFRAAGLRFSHAVESFTARRATAEEAAILELDEDDDLVVEVLRCSYAVGDTPVHCLDTVCAASRHRFRVPQLPGDDVF
jgi:GntR family transcriptional regulator